jgi:hypothetical protein
MDPGRLENQISQNRTKPTPLRRALHVDSGHIFFSKMDTICESDRILIDFPNMQKIKLVKVNNQ